MFLLVLVFFYFILVLHRVKLNKNKQKNVAMENICKFKFFCILFQVTKIIFYGFSFS